MIRYAFLQTNSTITHREPLLICFRCFLFPLVPFFCFASIPLLFVFIFFLIRLFFFLFILILASCSLLMSFPPSILFISNPSRICTDIAFLIFNVCCSCDMLLWGMTVWAKSCTGQGHQQRLDLSHPFCSTQPAQTLWSSAWTLSNRSSPRKTRGLQVLPLLMLSKRRRVSKPCTG
jgi:hypothetical protein